MAWGWGVGGTHLDLCDELTNYSDRKTLTASLLWNERLNPHLLKEISSTSQGTNTSAGSCILTPEQIRSELTKMLFSPLVYFILSVTDDMAIYWLIQVLRHSIWQYIDLYRYYDTTCTILIYTGIMTQHALYWFIQVLWHNMHYIDLYRYYDTTCTILINTGIMTTNGNVLTQVLWHNMHYID